MRRHCYVKDITSPAVRSEAPERADIISQPIPGTNFVWIMVPTAIAIDGAHFLRRFRWSFPDLDAKNAKHIAQGVQLLALWHLALRISPKVIQQGNHADGIHALERNDLYRIFFYDCPPLSKKMHLPVTKRAIDLSKTPEALFRLAVHAELQNVRKVALRLGRLNDQSEWKMRARATTELLADPQRPLTDDDFEIDTKQKGVDMRLGLDVAAMAFKKQVDQIVLVAADADFVPATKLARREGIDVLLDPMGGVAAKDLLAHSDGVRHCRVPKPPTL